MNDLEKGNEHQIMDFVMVILGNFVIALGANFFVLPSKILSGGVAGISVALQPIFHLPPRLVIYVLTISLFLLGAFILGKSFALKTVISAVFYPFAVWLTSIWANGIIITENALLASIYAGVCTGIGIGIVYRVGASTGGMDIPPLIINKYTHIPLPTLVMCIDGATVLLGASTYGIEAAMIGLVSVWICGRVIDKVMTIGSHEAKNVMIISNKHEEMIQQIYQNLNRGATILEATGGYTKTKKPVIMMVVLKKQYPILDRVISHVDKEAFVIVSDVNEVHGKGFSYIEGL